MKTRKLISITVLMLLLALPAMAASAGAPLQAVRSASMALTAFIPNPALIGSDLNFDLLFTVANIDPGVAGAEVYLGYDPALVAPPSTPMGAAEARPDFFGVSNVSINEVLPAASCPGGTSPCVHLVVAGPAQVTQSGVAARFHFRALVEGRACFTVLQSKMVDANGFDVVHTPAASSCVPIIFRITPVGTVLRQGVVANPNPGLGTLGCASVTSTKTLPTPTENFGPVNSDTAGKFALPNVGVGTYTFRASYPGYLTAEKTGLVLTTASPTTLVLPTITLRGGDVNGDNAINILDIGSIISKFGRSGVSVESASPTCATVDEPADINDDGLVNISDLAIAAGNWGTTGPILWP